LRAAGLRVDVYKCTKSIGAETDGMRASGLQRIDRFETARTKGHRLYARL
jgi:hypothetical protein